MANEKAVDDKAEAGKAMGDRHDFATLPPAPLKA